MFIPKAHYLKHKILKSKLVENIFSLSILQVLNLFLPLIVLPYLIRTVGDSNYGSYAVAYSMIQYVVLISSYGFGFSVTRQISQNKESIDTVSSVFNSTISARFLLAALSFILFGAIAYFAFGYEYLIMLLLGCGVVVGDIINPIWLYQGMENMKYMTLVNFICKLATTLLVFVFIRSEADYTYIIAMDSSGYLFAGIISYFMAFKIFHLKFRLSSYKDILFQLKEGGYIFMSTIFMTLYRNSNVFILKFFVPDAAIGVYAASEKIIKAGQAIATPISTALFPNVAAFFKSHTIEENLSKIKKIIKLFSVLLIIIALGFFVLAPVINKILLNGDSSGSVTLIRIMCPVILFGGINYILGIVGLVNLGKQKIFFKHVMVSGIASIMFLLVTVHLLGNLSAGISMVLAEVSLFILCYYSLFRSRRIWF